MCVAGIFSLGYFFFLLVFSRPESFLLFLSHTTPCSSKLCRFHFFSSVPFSSMSLPLVILAIIPSILSLIIARALIRFFLSSRFFLIITFFTRSPKPSHLLSSLRATIIVPPSFATVPNHPTQHTHQLVSHARPQPLFYPSLHSPRQIISCPTFHSPPFLSPLSLPPGYPTPDPLQACSCLFCHTSLSSLYLTRLIRSSLSSFPTVALRR